MAALATMAANFSHEVGNPLAIIAGIAQELPDGDASPGLPATDLEAGPATARAVADLIESGVVRSAHDVSDGGLLAAAAEMALAGGLGLELAWKKVPRAGAAGDNPFACLFSEEPSRYLLEIEPEAEGALQGAMGKRSLPVSFSVIGRVTDSDRLRLADGDLDVPIEALREAWLGTLDW